MVPDLVSALWLGQRLGGLSSVLEALTMNHKLATPLIYASQNILDLK